MAPEIATSAFEKLLIEEMARHSTKLDAIVNQQSQFGVELADLRGDVKRLVDLDTRVAVVEDDIKDMNKRTSKLEVRASLFSVAATALTLFLGKILSPGH